jgi:hypothetical protein
MSWIKLHRQIKDNWIWQDPIKFQWWIDILLTVNHTDTKVLIKNTLVECNKGESVRSLDSWARQWGVSKKAVFSFFKLLEKDGMVETQNIGVSTRLKVLQWRVFNDIGNDTETQMETLRKRNGNAKGTQTRMSKEGIKNDIVFLGDAGASEINQNFKKFLEWAEENAPNVLKMKEPLTEEQFLKLKAKYHHTFMTDLLGRMHNYKPLLTKYQSTYLTFLNWAKQNEKK